MWNKRPYQWISEHHRTGDNGWEYCIGIRINGRRFFIHLCESYFENSPSRLEEAWKRIVIFDEDNATDEEGEDEDEDYALKTDEERKAEDEAHSAQFNTIQQFRDWVVEPFLNVFASLAPPQTDITTLTMAHVYHRDSFECELRAVDDELVPGAVTKRESTGQELDMRNDGDDTCPLPPTALPVFRLDQVEVRSRWWERTRDMQQIDDGEHSVGGRTLSLLCPPLPARNKVERLMRMHERVASADLGPEVRIQRLFGVAVDDAGNVFKLLADPISIVSHSWYYNYSERPVAVREKWVRQVEATVEALHSLGFTWGCPYRESVVIDEDDNAWLVGFDPMTGLELFDDDSPSQENDLKGIAKLRRGLGLDDGNSVTQSSKL